MEIRRLVLLACLAAAAAVPASAAAQEAGEKKAAKESEEDAKLRRDMGAVLRLAVAEARKRRGQRVPKGEEAPVPVPLELFEKLDPEFFRWEKHGEKVNRGEWEEGLFKGHAAGSWASLHFTERPGGAARLGRAGAKMEIVYAVFIQACWLRKAEYRRDVPLACDEKDGFRGSVQIYEPRGQRGLGAIPVHTFDFEGYPDGRGGWRLFMEDSPVHIQYRRLGAPE